MISVLLVSSGGGVSGVEVKIKGFYFLNSKKEKISAPKSQDVNKAL